MAIIADRIVLDVLKHLIHGSRITFRRYQWHVVVVTGYKNLTATALMQKPGWSNGFYQSIAVQFDNMIIAPNAGMLEYPINATTDHTAVYRRNSMLAFSRVIIDDTVTTRVFCQRATSIS